MEEDIKNIEEMLEVKEDIIKYHSWVGTNLINSVENLLKAYKELKEEKRHTKYLLNKKKFFSDWYIGEIIMCEDIQHLLEEE